MRSRLELAQSLIQRELTLLRSEEALNWATFVARRNHRQFSVYLRLPPRLLEREVALAIADAASEVALHWPKDRKLPDDDPTLSNRLTVYDRAVARLVRNHRAIEREQLIAEQVAAVRAVKQLLRGDPDDEDEL